jgi:hypothetical protein
MLFNLVFCEKQIPRFARDDNEVLFFRKLSSRCRTTGVFTQKSAGSIAAASRRFSCIVSWTSTRSVVGAWMRGEPVHVLDEFIGL